MAKMDELSDDPKEFLSAALKSPEAYGFLVKHASVDTEKLYESMLPGIASALPPSLFTEAGICGSRVIGDFFRVLGRHPEGGKIIESHGLTVDSVRGEFGNGPALRQLQKFPKITLRSAGTFMCAFPRVTRNLLAVGLVKQMSELAHEQLLQADATTHGGRYSMLPPDLQAALYHGKSCISAMHMIRFNSFAAMSWGSDAILEKARAKLKTRIMNFIKVWIQLATFCQKLVTTFIRRCRNTSPRGLGLVQTAFLEFLARTTGARIVAASLHAGRVR